jgi:hypothetical protein
VVDPVIDPRTLALLVSITTLSPVTLLLASRSKPYDRTSLFDFACLKSTLALREMLTRVSCTPLRSPGNGVLVLESLFSFELSKINKKDVPVATYTVPAAPAQA